MKVQFNYYGATRPTTTNSWGRMHNNVVTTTSKLKSTTTT